MHSLILLIALVAGSQAGNVSIEAESVTKKNTADGFPLLAYETGFALLEIRIKNNSSEAFSIDLEELKVFSEKGKEIDRALPTDIAPKLVKFYTGGGGGRPWGNVFRLSKETDSSGDESSSDRRNSIHSWKGLSL